VAAAVFEQLRGLCLNLLWPRLAPIPTGGSRGPVLSPVLSDGLEIRMVEFVKAPGAEAQLSSALGCFNFAGTKLGHDVANKRWAKSLQQLSKFFIQPN